MYRIWTSLCCSSLLALLACASGTVTDGSAGEAKAQEPSDPALAAAPAPTGRAGRTGQTAQTAQAAATAAAPTDPAVPTPALAYAATAELPRELPADYLTFSDACAPGDVITIAAIGDIMGHRELQRQAYASSSHYRAIWSGISDLLGQADITYGNLEAPTADGIARNGQEVDDPGVSFDNEVYTGYARFNINKVIIQDLVKTGFDVVSTANNHSLDRDARGIDRTIAALRHRGLKYTGTRKQGSKSRWHTVTETRGMRIAWLACTLHTNFGKDLQDQVLRCFDRKQRVEKLVRKLAAKTNIDAVIVTPHWGKEYAPQPRERQTSHAQRWLDAGATAIIGSHPHVVETWAKMPTADGREGFVFYSLGNFISHQRTLNRRSSLVLYFGLRKDKDGIVRVVGARYVPLHMRMVGNKKKFFIEAIDTVGGPADARALLVKQLGNSNLMAPDEPLNVAPHCDRAWEFPTPAAVRAKPKPDPAAGKKK